MTDTIYIPSEIFEVHVYPKPDSRYEIGFSQGERSLRGLLSLNRATLEALQHAIEAQLQSEAEPNGLTVLDLAETAGEQIRYGEVRPVDPARWLRY